MPIVRGGSASLTMIEVPFFVIANFSRIDFGRQSLSSGAIRLDVFSASVTSCSASRPFKNVNRISLVPSGVRTWVFRDHVVDHVVLSNSIHAVEVRVWVFPCRVSRSNSAVTVFEALLPL